MKTTISRWLPLATLCLSVPTYADTLAESDEGSGGQNSDHGSSEYTGQPSARSRASKTLEEIIVTANRREQHIQDVPATIQAFSGESLEQQGVNGFADYLTSVPGLSFRDQGNGANRITLRGVSNFAGYDFGNGTASPTGLYINDVPVQGASIAPDLVVYDLERIEVLKGPQGTLYGEGAMGGAIRMLLTRPKLDQFESKTDVTFSSTEGGGVNYRARGALNLPIVQDRLALRLTGTYLDESGFVDNVATGERDQDQKEVYSVRAMLAAKFNETFSAEVLALHNVLEQDDYPQIDTEVGGNRIDSVEDRKNSVKGTLLALTLTGDFNRAQLTSVTSNYTLDREFNDRLVFGSAVFGFFGPVSSDPYFGRPNLKKSVSQEFRLTSEGDRSIDWVVGAFYRDREQETDTFGAIPASDLAGVNAGLNAAGLDILPANGVYFLGYSAQSAEQYAVYAETNIELANALELTLGARWFDESSDTTFSSTGYGLLSSLTAPPQTVRLQDDGIIPKVALAYEFADNHKLYIQAAKGFRSAAANLNFALGGDEGAHSDRLWSYEIGLKNDFADGQGIFNIAAFFLDWKGIQSTALVPYRDPAVPGELAVQENAGDAEIYGIETEMAWALTSALNAGLAAGYTHTELTRSLGTALVGAKLPSSPEWTASAYAEYRSPISIGSAFARLDVQYVAEQNAAVVQVDSVGTVINSGLPLPSYNIGNVRFGLDTEAGWGFSIFIDNVSNERAILGRGFETIGGAAQPTRVSVNRPRTYGLSISKTFP